jgi:hypothetical protein
MQRGIPMHPPSTRAILQWFGGYVVRSMAKDYFGSNSFALSPTDFGFRTVMSAIPSNRGETDDNR